MKTLILTILLLTGTAHANQTLYKNNCVRCHNQDPSKAGSIGPELVTTPKEVLKMKVPTGQYPKDYKPKRKTKIMPKFKLTDDQLESIYWYIQMFKRK